MVLQYYSYKWKRCVITAVNRIIVRNKMIWHIMNLGFRFLLNNNKDHINVNLNTFYYGYRKQKFILISIMFIHPNYVIASVIILSMHLSHVHSKYTMINYIITITTNCSVCNEACYINITPQYLVFWNDLWRSIVFLMHLCKTRIFIF